ncbi:segregation and condensation protein A [Amedibacillus sp. YH-ame6]
MAFTITIDQFEGPLDLMLHLIKDNKLDLFDLDMNLLTEQYLQYLNAMESMHLEVASEFLSELAGLIEYKSKKLLPREKVEIEEEYEEDQRDRLVKRLLEYQRFKEVSAEFEKSYEARQLMMEKPMSEITQKWMNTTMEGDLEGNPYDLIKAMSKVLRRAALAHPFETKMTVKELSLDERVVQIKSRLRDWVGKMNFEDLCTDCTDLHMVIVTFLSILDLIKHKEITFHIDEEETIWIIRGEVVYA